MNSHREFGLGAPKVRQGGAGACGRGEKYRCGLGEWRASTSKLLPVSYQPLACSYICLSYYFPVLSQNPAANHGAPPVGGEKACCSFWPGNEKMRGLGGEPLRGKRGFPPSPPKASFTTNWEKNGTVGIQTSLKSCESKKKKKRDEKSLVTLKVLSGCQNCWNGYSLKKFSILLEGGHKRKGHVTSWRGFALCMVARIALVYQSRLITSIKAYLAAQSQGKVCNEPANQEGSVRAWWFDCPCLKRTQVWRCSTGAHNDQNKGQTQQEVWSDQMGPLSREPGFKSCEKHLSTTTWQLLLWQSIPKPN